jgi:hypothetical protein
VRYRVEQIQGANLKLVSGEGFMPASFTLRGVSDARGNKLLGELLYVKGTAANRNYGSAQTLTGALAKSDPAVVENFHAIELSLRRGLGYPTA